MYKSLLLLFLTLALLSHPAKADYQFRFTEKCSKAYQQIIGLRLKPAAQLLAEEKAADPNNLVPYFLENYIDFFVLFFNEDQKEYNQRIGHKAERLKLMKQGPSNSPFTVFCQSIIHMQWAAVESKFGNRWAAGWDFRDAYKHALSNEQKFPSFSPNWMITGPIQMVSATIPQSLKWLASLLGIQGDMPGGKQKLDRFLKSNDAWARFFQQEGVFYQCYLQFYLLNQPDDALAFIEQHRLDVVNNHLFTYMAANLNLNNKNSRKTQDIVLGRNQSAEYMATPVWDFELGYAKLYHLETDAIGHFQRFLKSFAGNYYVKDVWLKLGYAYLIAGNRPQYKYCMQQVRLKGTTVSDADKRALKEAKMQKEPNLVLLKARLLSDGGYPTEAMEILEGKTSRDFTDPTEQLEFMYRVGRIYDDLKQYDKALQAYDATIQTGRQRTEYFAARAALQAGLICEKRGQVSKAISYFKTCIEMEGHDYEESLEQRAKAGLARCKK